MNSAVDDKYIERQIPDIPDAFQVLEDMYAKAPAEADIGKNSSAGEMLQCVISLTVLHRFPGQICEVCTRGLHRDSEALGWLIDFI